MSRRLRETPVICSLCNETFPNPTAAWDHDCPEWERVRRNNRQTLASHRNVIKFYASMPNGFWKRMVRTGINLAIGPNADLLDALTRMPMRFSFRISNRLVRRGLVKDVRVVDEEERERRRYNREFPEGEEPF